MPTRDELPEERADTGYGIVGHVERRIYMKRVPWISKGWGEGRLGDLWMVVHFLSGVCGGLSNVFLKLSLPVLMLSGLTLMVAWEIGEFAKGVRETKENRLMDLVVGLLGAYAGVSWASAVPTLLAEVSFLTTVLVTLLVCFIGWRAYRKRKGRAAVSA